MKKVRIIGHRGAPAYGPENSIESVRTAISMGAEAIETDVRLTNDGIPILMHDDRMESTTDGRGLITDLKFDEINDFRLRNGEPIPTLKGVLTEFGGQCDFIIDYKSVDGLDKVFDAVSSMDMENDVIFSSFDGTQLLSLKMKHPEARMAFLCSDRRMQMLTIAEKVRAEALHVHRKLCKNDLVKNARIKGIEVVAWTVNRPGQMKKLIDTGVDGIMTDKPDLLKKMIEESASEK